MVRMPDSGTIAAAFHQKAVEYDRHVLVQKRVVTHLVESIGLHLEQEPGNILDVGTGTGALLEGLHARYPHALLTGVDIAFNMCLRAQQKLGSDSRIVTGNAEYLPFGTGVFDLAVSASVLQWVGNLAAALNELRRVVRPGGDVSLAFFCEGSLAELQHCFRDATGRYTHGGGHGHEMSRLHGFHSVAEVTSLVKGMDFEQVVVTVEAEVDWYDDLHSLLRSIKNIGAGTVSGGAASGLGWRGILRETSRLYMERYGRNGSIPVTYNVLYLTARTRVQSDI